MRRRWIKVYVDQVLRGSIPEELKDPGERWAWMGLLLLAGDSPLEGAIGITPTCGYTDQQLAAQLSIDPDLLTRAKANCEQHGKIRVLEGNVIEIVNWRRYQSDYQRQRPYREAEAKEKLQHKVTAQSYTGKLQRKVTSEIGEGRLEIGEGRKKNKEEEHNGRPKPAGPLDKQRINEEFEQFWNAYPRGGRQAKNESRVWFGQIYKRGEREALAAGLNGYLDFLKHQRIKENFDQKPMYAKTFLRDGRWKEFIAFRYEAPL